jgi:hypothetical protein
VIDLGEIECTPIPGPKDWWDYPAEASSHPGTNHPAFVRTLVREGLALAGLHGLGCVWDPQTGTGTTMREARREELIAQARSIGASVKPLVVLLADMSERLTARVKWLEGTMLKDVPEYELVRRLVVAEKRIAGDSSEPLPVINEDARSRILDRMVETVDEAVAQAAAMREALESVGASHPRWDDFVAMRDLTRRLGLERR